MFLTATLESATASLASGFPAVCVFVNDRLDASVLAQLAKCGTTFVALRCAGYNNVDLGAAEAHGITVVRVPAYSPYAVAEFTVGVSLALIGRSAAAGCASARTISPSKAWSAGTCMARPSV